MRHQKETETLYKSYSSIFSPPLVEVVSPDSRRRGCSLEFEYGLCRVRSGALRFYTEHTVASSARSVFASESPLAASRKELEPAVDKGKGPQERRSVWVHATPNPYVARCKARRVTPGS